MSPVSFVASLKVLKLSWRSLSSRSGPQSWMDIRMTWKLKKKLQMPRLPLEWKL